MTTNDIVIVLGLLERAQDREAALVDGEGEFQRAIAQSRLAAIKAVSEHLKERITAPRPLPDFTRGIQTTPPTVEHQVGDSWIGTALDLPPYGEKVLVYHTIGRGGVAVAWRGRGDGGEGDTWYQVEEPKIPCGAQTTRDIGFHNVISWKPLPTKG
jgi:hypothetical protein